MNNPKNNDEEFLALVQEFLNDKEYAKLIEEAYQLSLSDPGEKVHRQEGESTNDCVQRAIPILIEEGKPQDQAVAIANSMCEAGKNCCEECAKG